MEDVLRELGFVEMSHENRNVFYKTYKGFKLFIGKGLHDPRYMASIMIGEMEISIPLYVDEIWVDGFDSENNGY